MQKVYVIEYKFKGKYIPHFEKYKDCEEKPLEYAFWKE